MGYFAVLIANVGVNIVQLLRDEYFGRFKEQ